MPCGALRKINAPRALSHAPGRPSIGGGAGARERQLARRHQQSDTPPAPRPQRKLAVDSAPSTQPEQWPRAASASALRTNRSLRAQGRAALTACVALADRSPGSASGSANLGPSKAFHDACWTPITRFGEPPPCRRWRRNATDGNQSICADMAMTTRRSARSTSVVGRYASNRGTARRRMSRKGSDMPASDSRLTSTRTRCQTCRKQPQAFAGVS